MIVPRARFDWRLRTRVLALGERTLVMGIVNVTPDSFSDGGEFATVDAAVAHALALLDAGADIVDVGGESTRPGAGAGTADDISDDEEQRRVLPVVEALLRVRPDAVVSVDTYRAGTAREALRLGAEIVNDVSGGLWDPAMTAVCAEARCGVVAMHTRGLPTEWAGLPLLGLDEVLPLVMDGLHAAAVRLLAAGCERDAVVLDPGFGFGKRGGENWVLLREFGRLGELGYPLLAALSRKRFLRGAADGVPSREALDGMTATASALAAAAGAHVVRVHDVAGGVRAVAVADALLDAEG